MDKKPTLDYQAPQLNTFTDWEKVLWRLVGAIFVLMGCLLGLLIYHEAFV